jgi:hypothetical protein
MKRISTVIALVLAFSTNSISSANANVGPEGINCPELSGATYTNLTSPLNVKALNFNGQYLQRVDQKTGKLSENPQGVLGCYKHFSANTGYDARWDVGVIDYINGKLKWTNDVGASWDLIADFSNFRFLTNETNPYFPASFLIERSFDPKTGDSSSCKQFKRQAIGFPSNSSGIISTSNPIFLAVSIDFSEQYSKSTEQELARFEFAKVENFWFKNSYGKSNLKIESFPTTIKLDQSGSVFEGGKEQELWPFVVDRLSKSINLSKYSGFVFATPANGPRLQAGYAGQMKIGKEFKPIVWMGGWNSTRESFVPIWKVVTHEFGHSYGLPDLYLTSGDNSAGKTLGPFDIMDSVTGISNSVTFIQRWMLGWLSDIEVSCLIPDATPTTIFLKPVNVTDSKFKGVIIPISEYESILIEARVKSEFDDLSSDQEGVLVYLSDTRIASGKGPLRIIPSRNSSTLDLKTMDDVDRFKFGALRLYEQISYGDVFVEFSGRIGDLFKVTMTKGNDFFIATAKDAADKAAAELKAKQEAEAKAAAELKAKQEAEAKAAADKAAAELKAKQEAEAKVAAELKAKQEAEAKAAADLKAKQDAAADKAALAKAQSELAAANAALADSQKVNREQAARITSFEEQFKVLSESVATVQNQLSQLNSKLVAALTGLNTANAKIKKICAAKPKPKGC